MLFQKYVMCTKFDIYVFILFVIVIFFYFALLSHSSPLVFSGVCVTRSLVVYVCFVDRCLSFCTFSFVHCVVCSSLIYYPLSIFKLFLNLILYQIQHEHIFLFYCYLFCCRWIDTRTYLAQIPWKYTLKNINSIDLSL
jgi:hypothetical protein